MVSLLGWANSPAGSVIWNEYPQTVNSNSVTVRLKPDGERPEQMAVIIRTRDETQEFYDGRWNPVTGNVLKHARWIPFATNLLVDLGPGDGQREMYFSYRYKGQTVSGGWEGGGITVQTLKPLVVITNPPHQVTSQPIIQLQGYCSKALAGVVYDLLNQNGEKVVIDGSGYVTDQYFDQALFEFTTNYFTCYDVQLTPGTNSITLRCTDQAGNTVTTNLTYVLSFDNDKTPPLIVPRWPTNGMEISGNDFTLRGWLDDDNAKIVAEISGPGGTNTIAGLVERTGDFWVEKLPLRSGANQVVLTATDAAGNVARTNFTVYQSEVALSIDPLPKNVGEQFRVTVTGRISPPNYDVWVNGKQATVGTDGRWVAEMVPVYGRSTSIFEATALPKSDKADGRTKSAGLKELVSAQANLGTNAITLNPSAPICGTFQLHMNNTSGRSFILLASTNLVEWTPILTNLNPDATFDYTDTNLNSYPCRFFRVVPSP